MNTTNMVGDGVKELEALGEDAVKRVRELEKVLRDNDFRKQVETRVRIHKTQWSSSERIFYVKAQGRTLFVGLNPLEEPVELESKVPIKGPVIPTPNTQLAARKDATINVGGVQADPEIGKL